MTIDVGNMKLDINIFIIKMVMVIQVDALMVDMLQVCPNKSISVGSTINEKLIAFNIHVKEETPQKNTRHFRGKIDMGIASRNIIHTRTND